MLIKNVKVFTEDKKFKNGAIVLEGDKIKAVYTEANMPDSDLEETIDGNGAYAIPGLIDLHFHGCKGDDFCDGTKEAIARIAEYEASIGVTAIAPATMTLPVEELEHIASFCKEKGIPAATVYWEYWSEETEKIFEKNGISLYVYTVNDRDQARRYISQGAEGICTDFLTAEDLW